MNEPTFSGGDLSLVPVLERFARAGFRANHVVLPDGRMKCGSCSEVSRADSLAATAEHRIEGASDPDDMQMVLGVECPICGTKGAVVVAYGPVASERDDAFLSGIDVSRAVELITPDTETG